MSINHPHTILVLLAGGKSSRAEKTKGLRIVKQQYWIDIVLKHYQQMDLTNMFIGLGYNHDHYLNNSGFLNNSSNNVNYSINKNPQDGSFSTLQTILKKALNSQWKFALILHIDCGLISENAIKALLKENKYTVVKPIYKGKSGHPIKLSRDFCKQLVNKSKNSQLDTEMRKLDKPHICWQKVEDSAIHYNLNTEESWKAYIRDLCMTIMTSKQK